MASSLSQKGYPERLATLAVTEGNHPLESVHLLGPWQDLFSDLLQGVVYPLGAPSKILSLACTACLLSSRAPAERFVPNVTGSGSENITQMHDVLEFYSELPKTCLFYELG